MWRTLPTCWLSMKPLAVLNSETCSIRLDTDSIEILKSKYTLFVVDALVHVAFYDVDSPPQALFRTLSFSDSSHAFTDPFLQEIPMPSGR